VALRSLRGNPLTTAQAHILARTLLAITCQAIELNQRWLESLFQTPTPLLFNDFLIRVRKFFNLRIRVFQTPATTIDPTVIYPCFFRRNDHTDSCYRRNGKVTPYPGSFFHKFFTLAPDPGPKEKRRNLPGSTPVIRIRSHLCYKLDGQLIVSVTRDCAFTLSCGHAGRSIGLCAYCGVGQMFMRGSVALPQDILFCASCA